MFTPSAFKKFSINGNNFVSGNFTNGSFVDSGVTWRYKKLGNFYFAFSGDQGGGQAIVGVDTFGGSVALIHTTLDRFALQIGVTVNTYYPINITDGALYDISGVGAVGTRFVAWNGVAYTSAGGNANYLAVGFIAN